MTILEEKFFAKLREAGMPEVPDRFSVVAHHQEIPQSILTEIGTFIGIFDRVTERSTWQEAVTTDAPEISRSPRPEVCFFSAWDFHLPPERPSDWQAIEFNDNGSGLFLAGLINAIFYELADLQKRIDIQPLKFSAFSELVASFVEEEARRFYGEFPQGIFLILDDTESLEGGKFQSELRLMRGLWQERGWQVEIASPTETQWDGRRLLAKGKEVSFIVNRSTDFFWQADVFSPLRSAYKAGTVYVAPNPFTYITRSDKRLLEFFSLPYWDEELGIQPEERICLSTHVPETHLLREDNIEEIASRKEEFFFKPLYSFASRGVLTSSQVGRSRLRRLIEKGKPYVAQKKVPKSILQLPRTEENTYLWTDLRVWAYRGKIFLLSGRASRHPELLDLTPPGGWIPSYVKV
jgi:hypothetical protein